VTARVKFKLGHYSHCGKRLCVHSEQLRNSERDERVARVGESVRVVEPEETENPADAKAGFKQSRTNIKRTKGG